jgi:hypothetical protein
MMGVAAPEAVTAPARTDAQRMDALETANAIRTYRAAKKRDLKAGRASVRALILDPPEMMQTMKVFDLLLATPKYGRVKVNRLMTQCRMSPSKTLGGMSQRQRSELALLLR